MAWDYNYFDLVNCHSIEVGDEYGTVTIDLYKDSLKALVEVEDKNNYEPKHIIFMDVEGLAVLHDALGSLLEKVSSR